MEKEIETRFERNEEDIRKLFKCTDESNRFQGRVEVKIENIEKSLATMTADIKSLLDKPQRRWDTLVTVAITALVRGVIGVMIASVFGGVL